jgi:hypothetical protein
MAQVTITIAYGTGGTATPVTGLRDIGTPFNITAIPTVGYDFVSWSDGTTVTTNVIRSVTPSVDATYTATFALHNWTQSDYTNIANFLNTYYTFAGLVGNQPNAAMANKMLPNVIAIQNEIVMFNFAKSFSLDTSVHYQNIVNILNSFNPDLIPIV